MHESRRQFADRLYAESHAHDQGRPRLERFRNLEPSTAELLGVLIRAVGARRILELGTSNGYSTLWLADAAEATGGGVASVDTDERRTAMARDNLAAAGLADRVSLRVQDAARTSSETADGEWEFVFLDSERPAYVGYLPDLVRTLASGGVLAVDNVLSHASEVAEFRGLVSDEPGVSEALVPTGAGALLIVTALS